MGKSNFIWKVGVQKWGFSTGTLWTLIMTVFFGFETFFSFLIPALIVFPVGGYFFGRNLWFQFESDYQKSQDLEEESLD